MPTTAERASDGRPIFYAADPALYVASEKEAMTDKERLEWKTYKLWQTTRAMERRDSVYRSVITSDRISDKLKNSLLGTPYPIIEPNPTFLDDFVAMRPHEHGLAILSAAAHACWMRARTPPHASHVRPTMRQIFIAQTLVYVELVFMFRSMWRLRGYAENDYECRKFGVMEDKVRLQRKKDLWDKYTAYKREWARRYDFYMFGMHPGEHLRLLSPCWLSVWLPSYAKTVDYPARKNPYFVSSRPLRPSNVDMPINTRLPADERAPIVHVRPELKYLYDGPINAERGPPGTTHSCAG